MKDMVGMQAVGFSGLHVAGRPIALIPWPREVLEDHGKVVYLSEIGDCRVVEDCRFDDAYMGIASQLSDELSKQLGTRWQAVRGKWSGAVRLEFRADMEPQEYRIAIGASCRQEMPCDTAEVVIAAGDDTGLRCAVQTVRQLVRQCAPALPVLRIHDKPDYKVRGYYLDVTRGRVPTLDYLKQFADTLCLYKYNQLQLYIEHTFQFEGLEEMWRGVGALSPDDIREFDRYCAGLGIELVPSVSTFGHLYMALRTKTYRHLGEFPQTADRPYSFVERQEHHTLNVSLEDSFAFSKRLMDEYLPLFSSHKVNLGADETFDLGKGKSRKSFAEGADVDVAHLYSGYLHRLCEHARGMGYEPMFWGDVALERPEVLKDLPQDVLLLNWLYSPTQPEDKVQQVARTGARQYVCPAVHGWNTTLPHLYDAWRNIFRLARFGRDCSAEGFLVTDWGDYGHINDPRLSLPGLMYASQCAWYGEFLGDADETFARMNSAISALLVGNADARILKAWDSVSRDNVFKWHDLVQFMELRQPDDSLNTDVAAAVAVLPEQEAADDCGGGTAPSLALHEAERRFLAACKPLVAGIMNNPHRAVEAIRGAIVADGAHTGIDSSVLRISAAGHDLFEQFGWWMVRSEGLVDANAGMPSAQDVAIGLEQWCEAYCAMWAQTSRESELGRIVSMVHRCADRLRDLPAHNVQTEHS